MFVNLAGFTVFPQEPPENSLSAHPEDLGGHTGLGSTLPLTGAGVAALPFCSEEVAGAGARMDDGGLDDNSAVLDEFFDMVSGVGIANLCLLCGVQPDFALAN